jgi:hypothetical protein
MKKSELRQIIKEELDRIREGVKLARIYDVKISDGPNADKFEQAVNKLVIRYKAMKEKPEIKNGEMTFKMVRVEDELQSSFDAEIMNLIKKYKASAKSKQRYV